MKTAVIGGSGQLGTDLCKVLGGDALALGHAEIEITDGSSVAQVLRDIEADVVINTAAYNKVDLAEDEPDVAFRSNAFGARNVAVMCDELKVPLCHISTDFVFGAEPNRTTPYTELDVPGPLSAYAISKLAGEHFVKAHTDQHYVIRTCGLYGYAGRTGNGNFVETMIRLGSERDSLSVVNDQFCTPTSTRDLAAAIVELIQTNSFGTYNITNKGQTSWFEFAETIFELAEIDVELNAISSAQFGAKAARPPYSVLDNAKLANTIGRRLPDWRDAVAAYIASR